MIVLNAAAQVGALAATLLIQTVYLIVVARVLGPEDFGRFSFAWSVVQVLLIGGDFGLHNTALRMIASRRERSREVCDLLIGLKLMVAVLVVLVMAALAAFRPAAGGGTVVLLVFGAGAALQSVSVGLNVGFQAHGRLYFASLNILLLFAVQAAFGLTLLWAGGGLTSVALAYGASCAATTLLNLVLFTRVVHGVRPRITGWMRFVRDSWAVGLTTFLNSLSARLAVLLLTFLIGPFAVGIYSAAARLPQSLVNLPQGILSAVLPALAATRVGTSTFRHLFRRSLFLMLALSVPLSVMLVAGAPWLVRIIYGAEYLDAVAVLRILGWVLIPMFVGMAFSHLMLSQERLVSRLPWTAAAGLAAHLGLGLWLIPGGGSRGAAWAVLIAECVLAGAYVLAVWREAAALDPVPEAGPRGTRPSVAVVVQRYGEGIIGGAESAARGVASRLTRWYDVEVLTTRSRDHRDWGNDLPEGVEADGPVRVRRFACVQKRSWRVFGLLSAMLFRLGKRFPIPGWLQRAWVLEQGPYCPDLVRFLRVHRDAYDAVVFFTILYYPTLFGLQEVREKAVLAPTAHDEAPLNLPVYRKSMLLPGALVFQSDFEREMVQAKFGVGHLPWRTAGVGVELGRVTPSGDYLLFVGRVEAGKDCGAMFDAAGESSLPLVIAGPALIPVPEHVRYEGVISEARKVELLEGCRAVLVPSRMESLSILALEGWAHGKPVLARSGTVVARMVVECGGGCVFDRWDELRAAVDALRPGMGHSGREYVRERFSWDQVVERYREMIEVVRVRPDSFRTPTIE